MLGSIVLAVFTAWVCLSLGNHISNDKYGLKGAFKGANLARGLIAGGLTGIVNAVSPRGPWVIVLIGLLLISPVILLIGIWFSKEGSLWGEMTLFAILLLFMFFPIMSAAARLSDMIKLGFLQSLVARIPAILWLVSFGIGLVGFLGFREKLAAQTGGKAKMARIGKFSALGAIALIAILCLTACKPSDITRVFSPKEETPVEETTPEETPAELEATLSSEPEQPVAPIGSNAEQPAEPAEEPIEAAEVSAETVVEEPFWGHYFNNDVQDDPLTAYDFGPSLWKEGMTALEADEALQVRWQEDPVAGVGAIGYADSILGTRMLGFFYDPDQGKDDWSLALNEAIEYYVANPDEYATTLTLFLQKNSRALKTLETVSSGLDDQMYQDPDVRPGLHPDLIVMETLDHSGHMLVYTHMIKGDKFVVRYRLDCGGQPTNVAEVMKITPVENKVTTTTVKPAVEPTKTTPKSTSTPTTTTPAKDTTPAKSTTPSTPTQPTQPATTTPKPATTTPAATTPAATTPKPTTTPAPTTTPNPTPTTPTPTTPTTPTPNPTPTPTPNPTPTPAPNPTPTTPEPEKPKDPTQGTQGQVVAPNDNKGSGPSTNNGRGAQESSAEEPEERAPSTQGSYSDYLQTINNLDALNGNGSSGRGGSGSSGSTTTPQQTPENNPNSVPSYTPPASSGGSSTPSTTVPGATVDNNWGSSGGNTVDNNGRTGTRNSAGETSAPINDPTPTKPAAGIATDQGSAAAKPSTPNTPAQTTPATTPSQPTGSSPTAPAASSGSVTDQGAAVPYDDPFD